jgi:hypothetical protein
MNKMIWVVIVIVGLAGGFFLFDGRTNPPLSDPRIDDQILDESNTGKASFLVFTNGIKRDFTASMYLNQSKEAYLTGEEPGLVVIEHPQFTWGEFFMSLPFSLTSQCLTTGLGEIYCDGDGGNLKFFLNGKEDPDMLDKIMKNNDKLLVTFGSLSEQETTNQIQQVPNPN